MAAQAVEHTITAMPLRAVHLDADCFFASVEQRRRNAWGKPLVVGANTTRGAVTSASYEARKAGIHAGMPISEARRRHTSLIVTDADHDEYRTASRQIMQILADTGLPYQTLSIDEAAIDARSYDDSVGDSSWAAVRLGEQLRRRIRQELSLPVSVGVSRGQISAKIAAQDAKPDGLFAVGEHEFLHWWHDLAIGRIAGVGAQLGAACRQAGIHSVGDAVDYGETALAQQLGRRGSWLWQIVSGQADRCDVEPDTQPKQAGASRTLEQDSSDIAHIDQVLRQLCATVAGRLLQHENANSQRAHTVSVTVRDRARRDHSRSHTGAPIGGFDQLYRRARQLLDIAFTDAGNTCRLVGVLASNFSDQSEQLDLLDLLDTVEQVDSDETTAENSPAQLEHSWNPGENAHHAVFGDGVVICDENEWVRVAFRDRDRHIQRDRLHRRS